MKKTFNQIFVLRKLNTNGENEVLYLLVPSPRKVIEKRIEFLEKKLVIETLLAPPRNYQDYS